MRKYVYEVPAIVQLENVGPGGYGFHVYLDSDLAIKARKEIINPNALKNFEEEGVKIVRTFFGKSYKNMPYSFAEDSWLVRGMFVPGDACDLSFSQYNLEEFLGSGWKRMNEKGNKPIWVDYSPHNVDSMNQAMCLRELFLNWANTANSCLID
jgi:hypothetical protein